MTTSFFLWPEVHIPQGLASAYRLIPVNRIEEKLCNMFPGGYPVLCTSGRAALYMALDASGISRRDSVGIFPYASHCVLDAVSRVGTPLTGPTSIVADFRVVYHQWGYVQEKNLPANAIEDCVDTLCIPGTALFPGGGAFEIWSLPKILGTTSGGVLWCRDEETANRIRIKRNKKGGGAFQWITRLFGYRNPGIYDYWQGAESRYRKVSSLQTGEIWNAIQQWDTIVSDRLQKLELVWPYAVDWLQKPVNRLPTVVPLLPQLTEIVIKELGLSAGYRMIEKINADNTRELVKTIPLPVYKQVPKDWLEKIAQTIGKENDQ